MGQIFCGKYLYKDKFDVAPKNDYPLYSNVLDTP